MSTASLAMFFAGAIGGRVIGELISSSIGRRAVRRRSSGFLDRPAIGVLVRTGRLIGLRPASDLAVRLQRAGSPLSLPDAMAIKVGATLMVLLLALPLSLVLPSSIALFFTTFGSVAGFLALDIHLARRAKLRRARIESELADVLDLLRVGLGAGYGMFRAWEEVSRRHSGVLPQEFGHAVRALKLGASRAQVLESLRLRCATSAVTTLVESIDRAERHGASLNKTLAAQAMGIRSEQARKATEVAAKAGPKIQLIAALLLVPSVLLLIGAALAPVVLGL